MVHGSWFKAQGSWLMAKGAAPDPEPGGAPPGAGAGPTPSQIISQEHPGQMFSCPTMLNDANSCQGPCSYMHVLVVMLCLYEANRMVYHGAPVGLQWGQWEKQMRVFAICWVIFMENIFK